MMYLFAPIAVLLFARVHASCYDPSPAFPVPAWGEELVEALSSAFQGIDKQLDDLSKGGAYNTSSFSVEVTSNTKSLWSHFHTAREQNATRPGVKHVDGDSLYRIASISKVFTVLGILQQHEAGNLSLDDPISAYIPELASKDSGAIPWKDITIRILASQLSGIPRDFAQSDLLSDNLDAIGMGMPPVSPDEALIPNCGQYNHGKSCTRRDLLDSMMKKQPLFAPNSQSTYSNVAFELLGLAIENATGRDYSTYIREEIFEPLEMKLSSLEKPSDEHAVLPIVRDLNNYNGGNYWDAEEGVERPTGGIYSSSSDMSKFARYVLTHYNAIATGVNWLMPASWAVGMQSFYGMPWEIFRTNRILENNKRPVSFVTKSGGVPGYYSRLSIMPEYGLGLIVLVGGDSSLEDEIQEIVTTALIRAAESTIWVEMVKEYARTYIAIDSSLNSSLQLSASSTSGLVVTSFIANGTDWFGDIIPNLFQPQQPWRAQLVPTLLFKDEKRQKGEIWRMLLTPEREKGKEQEIWDEFCITNIDVLNYAGVPLNELVFWHDENLVELTAWRVNLTAKAAESNGSGLKGELKRAITWFGH